MKERDPWVDNAKGIALLCILGTHLIENLQSEQLLPPSAGLRFLLTCLYAAQAPVFLFLSGVFANNSLANAGSSKGFIVNKLDRLAYPYLLWQSIYVALMLLLGHTHTRPTFQTFLLTPLYPFMHFWFLYVLALCALLFVGMKVIRVNDQAIPIIGLVMLAAAAFLPDVSLGAVTLFLRSFFYFGLGVFVSSHILNPHPIARSKPALVLLCFTLIPTFCGVLSFQLHHAMPELLIPVSSCLGIVCILLLAGLTAGSTLGGCLRLMGSCSIEIYILHLLAMGLAQETITRVIGIRPVWLIASLMMLSGIIIPLIVAFLDRRHRLGLFSIIHARRCPRAISQKQGP